jgi:hypothetical protein
MPQAKAAVAVADDERTYPAIEVFLESQSRGDVAPRFAATREALAALPKTKAEPSKRALQAIGRTEELLDLLFDTKDRLAQEAKGAKKGRR